MAQQKDMTSMRSVIEYLREQGELLVTQTEIDPIYEMAGIQRALDGSFTMLFEKVKGYPNVRYLANVFARRDRIAKIFGINDPKKIKFKVLDAIRSPIPPRTVENAPCQEVVITKDINVEGTIPILKHSEDDCGRILGGGIIFASGEGWRNGRELSFKRMHFRGKDWSSINFGPGTHLEEVMTTDLRGKRVPITVNICPPASVVALAAGGFIHLVMPIGTDEVGIAGGLQGSPIEICRAKTVDAYSIANSEWVIEGYVDTTQKVWESEEAEKLKQPRIAPFFPEWVGYLGRASKVFKFQATAITHRKDRPIFYNPIARSIHGDLMMAMVREACFYELANRIAPGLVIDVNSLHGTTTGAGIIFQVKKRRPRDEGQQRTILGNALHASSGQLIAIAVDEDIDIYSAEDVLWAITTRVDPGVGIIRGTAGRGMAAMPREMLSARPGVEKGQTDFAFVGGLAIDATVPFESKWLFQRPRYPVDKVNLKNWFTEQEIEAARALQSEYTQVLAERGW